MISSTSKKRALGGGKKKSPSHSIHHLFFSSPYSLHPMWRTQTQQVSSETNTRIKERGGEKNKKNPSATSSLWLFCRLQCDEHKGMPPAPCLPPLTIQRKSSARKKKRHASDITVCSDSSSEPLVQAMDRCKQRPAVVTSHVTWGTILTSASWPRTPAAAAAAAAASLNVNGVN